MTLEELKNDPDLRAVAEAVITLANKAEALLPKLEARGHLHNLIDPIVRLSRDVADFLPGEDEDIYAAMQSLIEAGVPLIDLLMAKEEAAYAAAHG